MLKAIIGTCAAGIIAAAASTFVAPAQAAEYGVYVGPTYQHSCRHWSERFQAWVWTCPRPGYGYYDQGPSFSFQFGNHEHYHHDYRQY